MPKDLISMMPAEISSYLSKEYGISLYPFAFFLHSIIREPVGKERPERLLENGWDFPGWDNKEHRFLTEKDLLELKSDDGSPGPWRAAMNQAGLYAGESFKLDREALRCLQRKVLNLRKKILKTIGEMDELVYGVHHEGREGKRDMAINWGAGELLCRLQSEYEDMSRWLLTIGRPPSAKTEAACLWAELFRREGLQPSWALIADLMDWFLSRLLPYELYKWVLGSGEASDAEYFKQKYYKQKDRWRLIYDYRRSREISIEFPGLPRRRWLLTFGETWDDFGIVLNADSREFHRTGFSIEMLEAARKVFQAYPGMRAGVVFPDLIHILVEDWVPKAG